MAFPGLASVETANEIARGLQNGIGVARLLPGFTVNAAPQLIARIAPGPA